MTSKKNKSPELKPEDPMYKYLNKSPERQLNDLQAEKIKGLEQQLKEAEKLAADRGTKAIRLVDQLKEMSEFVDDLIEPESVSATVYLNERKQQILEVKK